MRPNGTRPKSFRHLIVDRAPPHFCWLTQRSVENILAEAAPASQKARSPRALAEGAAGLPSIRQAVGLRSTRHDPESAARRQEGHDVAADLPGTGSNASMERTPDGKCGRPRTAEKTLAFHSKESMCVSAGGRRRRLQNLRPGEHADPGLVSVRDADGPGPQAPRVKS
jgi:hypothetical protein